MCYSNCPNENRNGECRNPRKCKCPDEIEDNEIIDDSDYGDYLKDQKEDR